MPAKSVPRMARTFASRLAACASAAVTERRRLSIRVLDLARQQPVHAVDSATEQKNKNERESGQPADLATRVVADLFADRFHECRGATAAALALVLRFRERVPDHPDHCLLSHGAGCGRLRARERLLRGGAHPFDEQDRTAITQHD